MRTWGTSWGGSFGDSWGTAVQAISPSGGFPAYEQPLRTKRDISKARKRFGIEDSVARAIAEVAARQAERLELDTQKRFEELNRELQLRGIQWESRYLEALNAQREALIDAEISARLKAKLRNDEEMIILMLLAAVV